VPPAPSPAVLPAPEGFPPVRAPAALKSYRAQSGPIRAFPKKGSAAPTLHKPERLLAHGYLGMPSGDSTRQHKITQSLKRQSSHCDVGRAHGRSKSDL